METVPIKIELFGIPRLRAGVAEFFVEVQKSRNRLGDVLSQVQQKVPELAESCFQNGKLQKEYVVNISGIQFTRDLDYELNVNDVVLIMSSDAGG